MAIETYADLIARVAATLGRDDLAAEIPDFVSLAEQDMRGRVWLRSTIRRRIAVLDESFEGLPGDFLEDVGLQLLDTATRRPLGSVRRVEPAVMGLRRASGATGRPRLYAISGRSLTFDPEPPRDGSLSMELTHYAAVAPLSNDVPSNEILAEYPSLYLYATLLQAAPLIREDERIALWTTLFDRQMQAVEKANPKVVALPVPLGTELLYLTGRAAGYDIHGG